MPTWHFFWKGWDGHALLVRPSKMHHSIWKILFVLGANKYLERLEGKIRKCLFLLLKYSKITVWPICHFTYFFKPIISFDTSIFWSFAQFFVQSLRTVFYCLYLSTNIGAKAVWRQIYIIRQWHFTKNILFNLNLMKYPIHSRCGRVTADNIFYPIIW